MGKSICEEQSPARLLRIRANLYELLTNAIPPDVIMKNLTEVLLRRVDDQIKHEIIQQAAFYDHRMHQVNNESERRRSEVEERASVQGRREDRSGACGRADFISLLLLRMQMDHREASRSSTLKPLLPS
jgi:hypothetical protein